MNNAPKFLSSGGNKGITMFALTVKGIVDGEEKTRQVLSISESEEELRQEMAHMKLEILSCTELPNHAMIVTNMEIAYVIAQTFIETIMTLQAVRPPIPMAPTTTTVQ